MFKKKKHKCDCMHFGLMFASTNVDTSANLGKTSARDYCEGWCHILVEGFNVDCELLDSSEWTKIYGKIEK